MLKKLILLFIILLPGCVQAATATAPQARIFDLSGKLKSAFDFFDPSYSGGVDLALGDSNGFGLKEIILCSGSGHRAVVQSYNASGLDQGSFDAWDGSFNGGCHVSAADLDGDHHDEIVAGAGYGGGPQIRIFSAGAEIKNFFAFGKSPRQGVRVTAADLGNDGKAEIIAYANLNSPAEYAVYGNDGHKIGDYKLKDFNSNGLSLAVGDFNGDGQKEIAIAGGFGNKPVIEIFGKKNVLLKKISYDKTEFTGGLNLASGDIDGDKKDEIIVTESFKGSGVVSGYNFNGDKVFAFSAFDGDFNGGVKVAIGDIDGDGRPEIVTVPERVGEKAEKDDYKFISVDLAAQTLYRYQNGQILDKYLISSGISKAPTPIGDFKVYLKRPNVRMTWYYGPNNPMNYDLPNVPWVASFDGPYTIHGAYWHHNFGHPMSHGCVNMRSAEAKIVYDWSEIGTPVVIN